MAHNTSYPITFIIIIMLLLSYYAGPVQHFRKFTNKKNKRYVIGRCPHIIPHSGAAKIFFQMVKWSICEKRIDYSLFYSIFRIIAIDYIEPCHLYCHMNLVIEFTVAYTDIFNGFHNISIMYILHNMVK